MKSYSEMNEFEKSVWAAINLVADTDKEGNTEGFHIEINGTKSE